MAILHCSQKSQIETERTSVTNRTNKLVGEIKIANNSHSPEHVKAVFDTAKISIASAIVINGSAAIIMLKFVAEIKQNGGEIGCSLGIGLLLFSLGVLSAGLGTVFAYLTNYYYTWINNVGKTGILFHRIGIGLIALSYLLYAVGAISSFLWLIKN